LFPQYGTGQMFNLAPMAYPSGFGGQFGMGLLNIFFGLGSFISGEWLDGMLIGFMQGGGIGVFVLGLWWFDSMKGDAAAVLLLGPVWAITVAVLGVGLWGWGVLSGFFTPFTTKTAKLNDPRNWTAALYPTQNGRAEGVLAFTAHF